MKKIIGFIRVCLVIFFLIWVGSWFWWWGFGTFIKLPWWNILLKTITGFLILTLFIPLLQKKIKSVWFIIIVLAFASFFIYYHEKSYNEYAISIFKRFISASVPTDVKFKKAFANSWLDYNAKLEFLTDSNTFGQIINDGQFKIFSKSDPAPYGKSEDYYKYNAREGRYYKEIETKPKHYFECELFYDSDTKKAYLIVSEKK